MDEYKFLTADRTADTFAFWRTLVETIVAVKRRQDSVKSFLNQELVNFKVVSGAQFGLFFFPALISLSTSRVLKVTRDLPANPRITIVVPKAQRSNMRKRRGRDPHPQDPNRLSL